MANAPSFTGNPDLEFKKQQIADRSYKLTMISTVIKFATFAAGAAMMLLVPGIGGTLGGALIGLGGPLITSMVTQKEEEKLKLDREFLETQFQGGNWGKGHWQSYREEVAERGYSGQQAPVPFASPPPYQNVQRARRVGPSLA